MYRKLKKLKKLKLLLLSMQAMECLKKLKSIDKRKRSCSIREINRSRKNDGFFEVFFRRMKEIDHEQFFIYTRMKPEIYNVLLNLISPFLKKNSLREPIQPECRLAVTLIYLSQATSFQSIAWSFKLGKETVRAIVLETSKVIWNELGRIYVAEPNLSDYESIAQDFWDMWDMPNCIGAVDGKHIAMRCPPNSGSQYFCYKKYFSIVLLACCDAKYRFTHVDVGAYGSQSDGGIFRGSRFGSKILSNELPIPPPKKLPNTDIIVPHFFVGDVAFPLGPNLMRPYPGNALSTQKDNFNKRLSRARRMIENSFGILVSRWRILLTTLNLFPENAERVVLACITLHNFIMLNDENSYAPRNFMDWEDANEEIHDGLWRSDVDNLPSIAPPLNAHVYGGRSATGIRNSLCNFFNI